MIDKCKSCWNEPGCKWYLNYLHSELYEPEDMRPIRCPDFLRDEDEETRRRHEEIVACYADKNSMAHKTG